MDHKIRDMFENNKQIIDIGGGLRIKGNRLAPSRAWIRDLAEKVEYLMLDPVADYGADIVGDIHDLPFAENSIEAIVCLAVLEHVENPIKAASEMYRVLKPGGTSIVYVPFLYYYHAEKGYYGDYWRFTPDSLKYIFSKFSTVELRQAHGPVETLVKLTPLNQFRFLRVVARFVERMAGKMISNNTSGWNVYLTK